MESMEKLKFYHLKKNLRGKGFEINTLTNIIRPSMTSNFIKRYRVEFYKIFIITDGEGVNEIDFQEKSLKKGDMVFIAKERVHRWIEFKNLKGYVILFTDEFLFEFFQNKTFEILDLFNETYLNPILPILRADDKTLSYQLNLLREIFIEDERNFDFNILTFAFRTLIAMIRKRLDNCDILKQKNNHVFLEFSKLVDKNFKEIKMVEAYADMLHVSKKTINLMTRKSIDMSAKQFIIYKILQKAKISLCFEEMTIANIAEELGFSEAYNLTKFFKKYTNQTPTEYRKMNKH